MSRAMGDDEPVEVEAQERQVADHVEDLVPARTRRGSGSYCR